MRDRTLALESMATDRALATFGVVCLIVTAGCGGLGGLVGGNGSLTFTASPITVENAVVTQAGYEVKTEEELTFERTFEVQGQTREVVMNAHMLHLIRSYQGAPLGNVIILSLPQISILGQQIEIAQQLNPIELISQAQDSTGSIQQQQKVGERTVTILGANRTVEVFRGTAKQGGQSAEVKIYIATFSHGGDTIIAVGIVPRTATQDEDALLGVFQGIEHR